MYPEVVWMKREIWWMAVETAWIFEGNRIDENGYLLNDNGEHKLDDNGQYIMSTYLITSSSDSDNMLKEAISDTNVPAPPEEDESDTTENNDMESEGITNEEAGLD